MNIDELHKNIGATGDSKELNDFINNPDDFLVFRKPNWKHKDSNKISSVSVKFDKYIKDDIIKRDLLERIKPKSGVFSSDKFNIKCAIKNHLIHKYILITDIKDYYNNISIDIFRAAVGETSFNSYIMDCICKIYFKDDVLRRGLHSSNYLAEYIGASIDREIKKSIGLKKMHKEISYSRYCDDIFLSSNDKNSLTDFKNIIECILKRFDQSLNTKKTKLKKIESSCLLGLRCYDKKLVVPKFYKNKVRAIAYNTDKMIRELNDKKTKKPEDFIEIIKKIKSTVGHFNYIISNSENLDTNTINKYTNKKNNYLMEIRKINEINPNSQKNKIFK